MVERSPPLAGFQDTPSPPQEGLIQKTPALARQRLSRGRPAEEGLARRADESTPKVDPYDRHAAEETRKPGANCRTTHGNYASSNSPFLVSWFPQIYRRSIDRRLSVPLTASMSTSNRQPPAGSVAAGVQTRQSLERQREDTSGRLTRFCGGWYGGRQPPVQARSAGPAPSCWTTKRQSPERSHAIARGTALWPGAIWLADPVHRPQAGRTSLSFNCTFSTPLQLSTPS
jgi:hypothetical protein